MGGKMSRVMPGVYVGGLSSVKSKEQMAENGITHICTVLVQSVEDGGRKHISFYVNDSPEEKISRYFEEACTFIHEARVSGGRVLIHCACGVSRSVTVTLAYLLVITDFSLADLFKAVLGARHCACPNSGFMQQLIDFENRKENLELRKKLEARFGQWPTEKREADAQEIKSHIATQEYFILHGVYPDETPLDDNTSKTFSPHAVKEDSELEKPKPLSSKYFTVTFHGQPRTLSDFLINRPPAPTEEETPRSQDENGDSKTGSS
ncbi:unnamed protein product [Calicophoron daubneyi]|uniref:Dual specificity protein phosphatase 22 n=1 Tax=Calicophoron daubneyi TaxID=300641 RepID=A0AAV2TYZ9_CALDB